MTGLSLESTEKTETRSSPLRLLPSSDDDQERLRHKSEYLFSPAYCFACARSLVQYLNQTKIKHIHLKDVKNYHITIGTTELHICTQKGVWKRSIPKIVWNPHTDLGSEGLHSWSHIAPWNKYYVPRWTWHEIVSRGVWRIPRVNGIGHWFGKKDLTQWQNYNIIHIIVNNDIILKSMSSSLLSS